MISLPGMQWGYTGSLDMPEYKEMISPMSPQGAARLWRSLDLSRLWASLGEKYKKDSVLDWLTSIGQDGKDLATPKDKLES